jgi:hypothetical protein
VQGEIQQTDKKPLRRTANPPANVTRIGTLRYSIRGLKFDVVVVFLREADALDGAVRRTREQERLRLITSMRVLAEGKEEAITALRPPIVAWTLGYMRLRCPPFGPPATTPDYL